MDPMSFTCPLVRDFFLSFFLNNVAGQQMAASYLDKCMVSETCENDKYAIFIIITFDHEMS